MSDQEIKNWDTRLADQNNRGWDNYFRRRLHLDTARVLELWAISGEYLYIEEVSSNSAGASIVLNRNTNDPLDLVKGTKIETVFIKTYITNDAQPGEWIDLIIGINFKYSKSLSGLADVGGEAQPVVKLTHANPNTNVTPASQIANRVCIKADVNNTQTAWIDFRTAAVQNACFPLEAGESIEIAISNLDQINANFEVGGECVFIVHEL